MAQQDDGSIRPLHTVDDVLNARFRGEPIFREGDRVEVVNKSLPDQPVGRFIISLIQNNDMVLFGVPKS